MRGDPLPSLLYNRHIVVPHAGDPCKSAAQGVLSGPAHAVIYTGHKETQGHSGPCTCGVILADMMGYNAAVWSRTCGVILIVIGPEKHFIVVPAHAGVIPLPFSHMVTYPCGPRTCGGDPLANASWPAD